MLFATIGTSWITDSFIESSKYINDIEIYAVYSRDKDKADAFKTKHNATVSYTDLDEMLRDDKIDSVYIASPNAFHYEMSKKCLLAGKNVLCEKPATVTESELIELYDIADKNNLIFLEAMKSIHSKGLEIIKNNMSKIEPVRSASIDFSQYSSKYPAYLRGELPNIFNPEMRTGALMDLGVYCVYAATELFGVPLYIKSDCQFLSSGADCSGTLIFHYPDNTVTITYSKIANGFIPSKILGEKGAITFKSVSKLIDIDLYLNDGSVSKLYEDIDENIVMSQEIKSFYDFCNNENLDHYEYCKKTALEVSRLMEITREQLKLGF